VAFIAVLFQARFQGSKSGGNKWQVCEGEAVGSTSLGIYSWPRSERQIRASAGIWVVGWQAGTPSTIVVCVPFRFLEMA
jgi:hypothetical protein